MNFTENKAIYLQIAEWVFEQILLNQWAERDRVPSVRELGMRLEVNPNTVMRAYDFLQKLEVIENKRGVGYFVNEGANDRILAHRKRQFVDEELPLLFKTMSMVRMSWGELEKLYAEYTERCR